MKKTILSGTLLCLMSLMASVYGSISIKDTSLHQSKAYVTIQMDMAQGEQRYLDHISMVTDNPQVAITNWRVSPEAKAVFDPSFNETKKAISGSSTLTLETNAQSLDALANTSITVSYYSSLNGGMVQEVVAIRPNSAESIELVASSIATDEPVAQECPPQVTTPIDAQDQSHHSWSDRLARALTTTESLWIRLLLVFALGLLMSLTPCIYPMIPITAGILQAQGSKSFWRNIAVSLAYTSGIATTFALLGLSAAYTGQLFGSIMSNPVVVLAMVALITYLALSMLGLYEMYIPSFMQPKHQNVKRGSLVSAFLFGAASGTFASPCLSPGLVLLLSIVTALKNALMGFVLLFTFGIGLSVPLLLVGSFSSSLNLMPRAGMWMVEIKKMLGIVMLAMSFYFLKFVFPESVVLVLMALTAAALGVWYLRQPNYSSRLKALNTGIGICAIALATLFAGNAIQTIYFAHTTESSLWHIDYRLAHAEAVAQNTKLLIDIGAPFCSICKAIDKTLFADAQVLAALYKLTAVKIDGSDTCDEAIQELVRTYKVVGFPTVLLIDPTTGAELKRWGPELYGKQPGVFIAELEEHI